MHRKGVSASLVLILLAAVGGGYYMMQQENGGDFSLPGDLGGIISGGGPCDAVERYAVGLNNSNLGNVQDTLLIPWDWDELSQEGVELTESRGSLADVSCTAVESPESTVNETLEAMQNRVNDTNRVNYSVTDAQRVDVGFTCVADASGCYSSSTDLWAGKTSDGWKLRIGY